MKKLPATVLLAFMGIVSVQAQDASPQPTSPAAAEEEKKLAAMPVEDLISKLQEESKPGLGSNPLTMVGSDDTHFQGGVFGSKKPDVSPVMRELINRGIDALPALIAHLPDARPTKLTIDKKISDAYADGVPLASAYDARDRRPSKQPPGISKDPYTAYTYKQVKQYTLKVGDFCYIAVGQIVNRDLNALNWKGCVVINTPVGIPVLAGAVKADWSGLTREAHKKSLEEDALRFSDVEALKRLYVYYPESFDAPAVKLLNRPMYSVGPVSNFLSDRFFREKKIEKQRALLAGFRKAYGETSYLGVLQNLLWVFTEQFTMEKNDYHKIAAHRVMADSFQDVEPYDPPFINAASAENQAGLINSLATIPSKAVDEAVAGLLQRTTEMLLDTSTSDSVGLPGLAEACAQRLMGKPEYEPLVRSSLEKVISNLRKVWIPDGRSWGGVSMGFSGFNYIKILQGTLDKLPAKPAEAN